EWVLQTLVVLVALGFPIALVLAWAFELTPEGIVRTEDVAPNESVARGTGRKLTAIIIAVTFMAVGLFLFQMFRARPAPIAVTELGATTAPQKSIAVLPFVNMSSDKENEYFVDGIQDEILTRLAKIAALKVISRTSTQHYKSAPENLREIATQLEVAHILEGSVQKSADSVRVNVQLIKAANDSQLWADTFDRNL